MLADPELNIIYINNAATRLMREAEPELQQDMRQFSVASLLGSNIGVFLGAQRQMLATLDKPQSITITLGKRPFDLMMSPLQQNGRRIGVAVEWADARSRLEHLDHSGQLAAIGRAQAVIEFTPDGTILTANENFQKTMGYGLSEMNGRHHSMFVDAAERETAGYRAFWDRLGRGEAHRAQFRRMAKNGHEIWLEASYNPILDAQGRVTKVVKFAVDVTDKVKMLADLKSLIDSNFTEIDGAISRSSAEAESAAHAANETSGNVDSVTENAAQLAASIGEIAQSMATSRSATENAFNQATAVGRSTAALAGAAQAMSGIVGLIRSVASQINLLALNATIEAARAGEAGRGFAVVASEVKNLAVQAARATEQISGEIDGIQTTSSEVATALNAIRDAVTSVRESVAVTAAAVEEQSAVTRTMSVNMQSASRRSGDDRGQHQ